MSTGAPERAGLIVMKFGGTSLGTEEQRARAVECVRERLAQSREIVVVVSAMGRAGDAYATDTLKQLLAQLAQSPPREIDALLSCGEDISAALFAAQLEAGGIRAVSLRGYQAGIITDESHGRATIREIRPARIREHLGEGRVVVVAGFQGVTPRGEITTLGRGGSDTTAIALAAALNAERAEIITDVDGVLTADPRRVPEARPVETMTHREAAELACRGAKVLHPHAADLAREAQMPVWVRGPDAAAKGTFLVSEEERWLPESLALPMGIPTAASRTTSVTSMSGIAQVSIRGRDFSREPEVVERIFGRIAAAGISLDMFNISRDCVAFTLDEEQLAQVNELLAPLHLEVAQRAHCAKVTLVGGGIHGIPGIMHRVVATLACEGIPILQSVDSNTIISVLIDESREEDAVHALHHEFFD
jgi:aspartate kinase